MTAEIEDTYAEAFKGYYSSVLVTAKNKRWLYVAVNSAIGFATSGVGCSCEAGLDQVVDIENTPDKRIGAILQFWIASWNDDPLRALELELIHRIGQCILTAPTTAVWSAMEFGDGWEIGRKLGFFGDGFQRVERRYGRVVVNIPRMMGEFLIEKDLGYASGIMGGNLWFLCKNEDSAIMAAESAAKAISNVDGVITPFPGGVCSSGSKVGSVYKFLVASTNEKFCPTLKDEIEDSNVPDSVSSISEVVFNGISENIMKKAMGEGINAAINTTGLVRISAGNYGGKLGAYKIYLKDPIKK